MPRLLAIDYGTKRCGIAVTDNLQLVANVLTTVHTKDLEQFLATYFLTESVTEIVIGMPRQLDGNPSQNAQHVVGFMRKLAAKYPQIPIIQIDERFTSSIAQQTILASGASKKQRADKALVDSVAAVIILQSYMEQLAFQKARQ
jgi:putative Holliday junction resolvase